MKLDRTKHNKFVTGAVYGNTTSGGITPSSSTASAVGGGGTTVIIQGGGGSQEPVELGLGDLTNVGIWANEVATEDRFMVQVADGNQWVAKPISDIVYDENDLAAYAKISYVNEKLADKVDNAFFLRIFGVIGENDEEIPVNDVSSTIKSIQAKFGLWTYDFLSAIGLNPTDGEITAISLASLNDVLLNQQLIEGQALVWNGSFWTNQSIESGLDENSLQKYLYVNKYVTQDYVTEQLLSYATVGELNQFKVETSESLDNLQSEINDLSDKKLDKAFFKALFGLMDDDVEIEPNAKEIPESASIKAKFGLWTEEYLSALGMNPANGEVALTLSSLNDVQFTNLTEGQSIVWDGSKWINQLIESGLNESALAEYLTNNNYAKKSDIPSLSGYATEQWVLGKGYATTSDLDMRIDALVNGAPQAYDTLKEIADVLAGNVNSISDILTALGNKADKATTLSGYGITDAYTITQIDSIVNGLSGNISTLQGYFTDGVANSALRLSDNGSYTAWGQTFFTNGKPKSVSGALTNVTDITSSGTITTNKIVIGNGTIEWDEDNEGFKIVGGLYTESYLSAKGADTNDGSSSGGGLIESLWKVGDLGKTFNTDANDTFNAYAINTIHNRVSVLEGKATNVSFTQSLTSGTQIGTITIDGASKTIYAPTIPTNLSQFTDDVVSGKYLPLSGGTINGTIIFKDNSGIWNDHNDGVLGIHVKGWDGVNSYSAVFGSPSFPTILRSSENIKVYYGGNSYSIIHSGNYTDYTYSKSTIDTKLGEYLPLSGGTLTNTLTIQRSPSVISFTSSRGSLLGYLGFGSDNTPIMYENDGSTSNILIHSGNIGSQSVASAAKLTTARTIWGQSFDGTGNVSGVLSGANQISFDSGISYGIFRGIFFTALLSENDIVIYNPKISLQGNVGILNSNPKYTLDISGTLYASDVATFNKRVYSNIGFLFNGGDYGIWCGGQYTSALSSTDIVYNGTKHVFSSGNVGIGTNNPQYKLDISGVARAQYLLFYGTDGTTQAGYIGRGGASNNTIYLTSGSSAALSLGTNSVDNRLYIDTSGNVGIGTTSPQYMLDVAGTMRVSGNLSFGDTKNYYIGWRSNNALDYVNWYGHYFKTRGEDRMCIESYGNVGIGTTSPSYKLEVNGTLHASGAATFGSSIISSDSIESTEGHIIAYGQIRISGTGSNYSGLFLNNYITSGGSANDIWLYNPNKVIIYGSSVDVRSALNCSSIIYATTGIWSDGYVSAKGQNTSSDMRLKNVLNDVVLNVSDIANAPSIRFAWKNGGGIDVGSSAQYWKGVLPDAVKEQNSLLEMQYGNIALLSAIALAKNVETHEERIARLEKENEELRTKIDMMERGNYE